jgi:hypothetical protein
MLYLWSRVIFAYVSQDPTDICGDQSAEEAVTALGRQKKHPLGNRISMNLKACISSLYGWKKIRKRACRQVRFRAIPAPSQAA